MFKNKNKVTQFNAFWKGSIMTDLTLPATRTDGVLKALAEDFFACYSKEEFDGEIANIINYLDGKESDYHRTYQATGNYCLGNVDKQIQDMLLINELVKRGIRPNDNFYGITTLTY
jgi:hypothetical protein